MPSYARLISPYIHLPNYLVPFLNFFLALFVVPLLAVEGGSLSSTTTTTGSPPSVGQALFGPVSDLEASTAQFSVAVVLADDKGILAPSGTFRLFRQTGLLAWTNGRASAQIRGPLQVELVVLHDPAMTVPALVVSGACAIIPEGTTAPDSIARVAQRPGSCTLQSSLAGSTPGVLGIPPGIQTDALLNQVLGADPVVCWHFTHFNVKKVILKISGTVTVAGLGYPTF